MELHEILEFFTARNKSSVYSRKLYKLLIKELNIASKSPGIGKKTKYHNIKGLIIDNYIIFYRIEDTKIVILKIWDCRQNPENLKL